MIISTTTKTKFRTRYYYSWGRGRFELYSNGLLARVKGFGQHTNVVYDLKPVVNYITTDSAKVYSRRHNSAANNFKRDISGNSLIKSLSNAPVIKNISSKIKANNGQNFNSNLFEYGYTLNIPINNKKSLVLLFENLQELVYIFFFLLYSN